MIGEVVRSFISLWFYLKAQAKDVTCHVHHHDDATCTTCHRVSANLEVRLGIPNQTCFHVKQAARSRRVSRADHPPSILWRDRQTEARLILRHKLRNCHGDFETQITKPELSVLRPKLGNRRPWFWSLTKKHAIIVSLCTVQTTHGITRPPDRPATEYLTCAWPSPVLYTRSPTTT
jgi:hypothetical protein